MHVISRAHAITRIEQALCGSKIECRLRRDGLQIRGRFQFRCDLLHLPFTILLPIILLLGSSQENDRTNDDRQDEPDATDQPDGARTGIRLETIFRDDLGQI